VIVELKAVTELLQIHACQMLNYLRVSDRELGLVLNFGSRTLGIVRKIWTNNRKCLNTERQGTEGAMNAGDPEIRSP
jgi:hypothetical protein